MKKRKRRFHLVPLDELDDIADVTPLHHIAHQRLMHEHRDRKRYARERHRNRQHLPQRWKCLTLLK